MIRRLLLAVAIGVGLISVGWALQTRPTPPSSVPQDASSPALRISWAEFKKLYDDGKVVVVDVRDPLAFEIGHIPKARSIPVDDIERRAAELKKGKAPVVTYCA